MEDFLNIDDLQLSEGTLADITNDEQNTNPDVKDPDENKEIQENDKGDKSVEDISKETKETKTETNKEKAPSSESNEDSSTFSVFANLLKEEGVLSLDEEDFKNVKTAQDLAELVKKQIQHSKFENLSESQKRYLEAVEAGIPHSEFEKIEKQLSQLEKIDDEILENNTQARFDIIAHDWIAKGISKEKAVDLANRSIKLGTDKEDAKEALESLIKIKSEEYKQTLLSKKETNKVSLEELKKTIDSKDVILKDIKLTPKQKTDLYNTLSVKVDTDEAGQPINEFNKWRKDNGLEAEIILGTIYNLTNKFQNLGKIMEVSKSKASIELEQRLRQNEQNDLNMSLGGNNNKSFEINI